MDMKDVTGARVLLPKSVAWAPSWVLPDAVNLSLQRLDFVRPLRRHSGMKVLPSRYLVAGARSEDAVPVAARVVVIPRQRPHRGEVVLAGDSLGPRILRYPG
eukprot:scaffold2968_cov321-Pinguiococcus_pyrenoidosus.AAC.16